MLIRVRSVLTRCTGYLTGVTTHSLNPYRGCSFGKSLCGVACYVRHNRYITEGREWGSFLEAKENAAEAYLAEAAKERRWARRKHGEFSIFMASATDPFPPQEARLKITQGLLGAMAQEPPDKLIVQTHSPQVAHHAELLKAVPGDVRVHLSVESDRDRLPGLPPPAASVARRLEAGKALRKAGVYVVVTMSPLHPVEDPVRFFRRLNDEGVCDALVLDHFIGGDGSRGGARTRGTSLPEAMESLEPASTRLAYRDHIAEVARQVFRGPVGVGAEGFAGRWLPTAGSC